jgi:DNA polymerase I-like protein with 3'-5' exonuclease and polymerase domains
MKNYKIIKGDLKEAFNYVNKYSILSFDTETTGLKAFKDKVIGFSFSGEVNEGMYVVTYEYLENKLVQVSNYEDVVNLLEIIKNKELLMWNASFDIRMIRRNYGVDLLNSLTADGQLMKHIIDENSSLGLKQSAKQYYKEIGFEEVNNADEEQQILKEEIIKNGGSASKTNYELYKASSNTIGRYACADADLTLRLCRYLSKRIVEEGLDEFFYDKEVMPFCKKCVVDMEDKGIRINLKLRSNLIEKCNTLIEDYKKEILFELENTYEFQNFYINMLNSNYQDESLILKKAYAQFYNIPLPKTSSGQVSLKKSEIEKLTDKKHRDFLLGEHSLSYSENLKIKNYLHTEIKLQPKINISSKSQLSDLCFNYFQMEAKSKTAKGTDQFNKEFLDSVPKDIKWLQNIKNINKINKILGTYLIGLEENLDGDIFYPYFKQAGTLSGRLSSNLQQLPRPIEDEENDLDEEVKEVINSIRSMFIPREGYKFIICDQSSLEPRVFASVSKDKDLINVFLKDEDLYSRIAIGIYNLKDVSAQKNDNNYLKNKYPHLRQMAKVLALGVPYGMSAYAAHKSLGISKEEAESYIKGYLKGFPTLAEWMEDSKNKVHTEGIIKSIGGRIRHLQEVKNIYQRHKENLLDWKYREKLCKVMSIDEVSYLYDQYKNGINNSRNFQIQSLAASIMNKAGIEMSNKFKELDIDATILLQIHDEYVIEVKEKDVDKACKIVQDSMENTTTIATGLVAIPNVASNFGEGHE